MVSQILYCLGSHIQSISLIVASSKVQRKRRSAPNARFMRQSEQQANSISKAKNFHLTIVSLSINKNPPALPRQKAHLSSPRHLYEALEMLRYISGVPRRLILTPTRFQGLARTYTTAISYRHIHSLFAPGYSAVAPTMTVCCSYGRRCCRQPPPATTRYQDTQRQAKTSVELKKTANGTARACAVRRSFCASTDQPRPCCYFH